jgi:AcrR family transcriptional regulator
MDKAARRQQLLSHARDVFAKRGYHAAKIDDIVTAAGVARGTFYLYFEDKRAIFEELIDRVLARIGMTIIRVDPFDPSKSVAEQVRENIVRIVGMLVDDRATTKILLADAHGIDPSFDRKLQSFFDELLSLLEESLSDGVKLGVVETSQPRVAAILTMGALRELLIQVVVRDLDMPFEDVVDAVYVFLSKGYLRIGGLEPKEPTAREPRKTKGTMPRGTS